MEIQVTNAGLSMTMSDKETLSSRWLVRMGVVVQAAAYAIVFASVGLATRRTSDSQNGCCFEAIWWGKIKGCGNISLWIYAYLGLHFLVWLHGACLARQIAPKMDQAEKQKHEVGTDTRFAVLQSTCVSKWWQFVPLVLADMFSLEMMLRRLNQSDPSGWVAWGQRTTLTTLLVEIAHWIYISGRGTLDMLSILWRMTRVGWGRPTMPRRHNLDAETALEHGKRLTRRFFKDDGRRS
jgi:hypothetical protein